MRDGTFMRLALLVSLLVRVSLSMKRRGSSGGRRFSAAMPGLLEGSLCAVIMHGEQLGVGKLFVGHWDPEQLSRPRMPLSSG